MSAEGTERNREGTGLSEIDQRLQEIFSHASVGIAQIDLDGGWLLVNKRYCEMLGYSEAELRGKTLQELTHPDDLSRVQEGRQQLLACEISSHAIEKRFIRKDGTIFWGRLHRSLARDPDNRPKYFIAVVEDITEKIQADRALRDAEQRLALAQEAAHLGVWDRDLRTDVIAICGKYAQLHGLPPDRTTLTLEECVRSVHPDDRERVQALRREAREQTRIFDAEYRVIWPDGSVHWLRAKGTVLVDDSGLPIRTMGVIEEVTQRKQTEAALRESEDRLKSAERLAHVGNWVLDLKSDKVSWSAEMFRIFGQPRDYTPSYERFLQMIVPRDRESVERLNRDFAKHVGYSREYQIVRPSGELRTVCSNFEVLMNEEGLPERVFGACQDVTDLRRAQVESFARQKMESVGTLASGIAHDFNNLLGGILAQAEVGLGELATGSNPEEELKSIRNVAIRGSEIVRQLMIYAGRESDAVGLVDLSQIVKEMIELLRVSISKHARVEADLGQDLGAVRAGAAQLRQIVLNLVMNASEAIGDRDGVIRVTTGRAKVSREPSGSTSDRLAEGDYMQFEVSDTGCGMTQETLARIFEPFFTTKSAGHGLGLAVVDGIVRSLGGTIHVSSEPGRGTTFQILLHCAETTPDANGSLTSGLMEPARTPECAVLVVEDEDPLRQAVVKVLRTKGFVVLEATNGSAAIDLLRANEGKIDVILLDMTIPGASSHEVVAEVAQTRPDIRVILTSAYSQEMLTLPTGASQISGFIRKPFQLEDLVKMLRSASAAA